MKNKFSDLTVNEAIPLLAELNDSEAVESLSSLIESSPSLKDTQLSSLPIGIDLPAARWKGTEHSFAYIENDGEPGDLLNMSSATIIKPDLTLKGQAINIRLGSLYTMNYPGWGVHNVLLHFKCNHAIKDSAEMAEIEFQQKFRSKEDEGAGSIGEFIFTALKVPKNGLQFKAKTVNVSNDEDESALKVLESNAIKDGLNLLNASVPTLAPLTSMAQGILGLLLTRNKNKIVQEFTLGLDFNETTVEVAKIRLGTYVVVQAKRDDLDWNEWQFKKSRGLVVNKADPTQRLPYNHITFNISKYEAE